MFWVAFARVRRRCFVCTAPSPAAAAAAVGRESCTFLEPAAGFQNCRFLGEKVGKIVEKVGSGVAAEARPPATEMGSGNQVQSHPTIRAGNSSDCNRYFFTFYISHLEFPFGQTFWAVN